MNFFKTRLFYLGHVVPELGIETDSSDRSNSKQSNPKTVTDVRSFLGFTNYYQRFIKGYAPVSQPLYSLILGNNASRKKQYAN